MQAATIFAARCEQRNHSSTRAASIAAVLAAVVMFVSSNGDLGTALAQTTGIVANGNAVVTGFSGALPPTVVAPGVDPVDKTFIDLQGPAARVFDLQAPGAPPQAQLLMAPKPFTVTAAQVGQVFGVALDGSAQPNVFVAATSVYGLPIVVPAGGAQSVRVKQGAPNAAFMPGQFGPAQPGGGPGSIWRIDGTNGQVRLFANVTLDGVANSGPALGGLAFDSASNTLFAADRATGMIHAFDPGGKEVGRYDHGVTGRSAAGLTPVSYDPAGRLDITNPKFRTGDPATWGYAAPQRLIFGLGVRNARLYYAVAADLQIWSVAIVPTFGADPRLELSVAPGPGPSEISKITFDDQGRMLLAERAAPSGAADFMALTVDATGRVLRYLPALPGTQGPLWQPQADEYAIGFARQMRNGNGGVAIGFGYDEQGRIDRTSCGQFLWSTGEQLRSSIDPALAALLAQGGPAEVNGLQGNDLAAIVPANAPPLQSYFADYNDQFEDPQARGRIGDIAIRRVCGQTGFSLPGWYRPRAELMPGFFWNHWHSKKPPTLDCPPGSGNQCACPAGTTQQAGFQCCPVGLFAGPNGQCLSPCPDGSTDPNHLEACLAGFDTSKPMGPDPTTWTCLDGSKPVKNANGYSCPHYKWPVCPSGFVADPNSDTGCKLTPAVVDCNKNSTEMIQIGLDGSCQKLCQNGQWGFPSNQCCPDGTLPGPDGKCGKPQQPGCPPEQVSSKGVCCPTGTKPQPDGSCKQGFLTPCPPPWKLSSTGNCCPQGTTPQPDGSCYPIKKPCPPEQLSSNGTCCPVGAKPQPDGSCNPPIKIECKVEQATPNGTCCPPGTKPQSDNTCSPPVGCPTGTSTDPVTGKCCLPFTSPAQCHCPTGQLMVDGKCGTSAAPIKKPDGCFAGYVQLPNKSCCLAGQATAGGQCCPAGQKPDAEKRKCVSAGGATFAPGLKHVPLPIVIPNRKGDGRETVTPPPSRPPVVVQPPKRFGPPKRFTPRPIIQRPGAVGGKRIRRQLDR